VTDARISRRDRWQTFGFGVGATLVRIAPESLMRPLFRLIADVIRRRHGSSVRQLERNLRRVVGPEMPDAELRALVRDAMRSYGRYWLEFFRLPDLRSERILGRMLFTGEDVLVDALARGRGAVLALPHSGNWDHAGAWLVLRGHPFTTVAERLRPEALFDRFVAVREKLGMEVLPLTGSWCGWIRSEIKPPVDGDKRAKIAAMTQALADRFAEGIAEHPQDWHMLQPLWLADVQLSEPQGAE
jgi:phosphatidylinositol dimannoside acyltransferase